MNRVHRHPDVIRDDILEAKARFDERYLNGLAPLHELTPDRRANLQRTYRAWERLIARSLLEELEASERFMARTANWRKTSAA